MGPNTWLSVGPVELLIVIVVFAAFSATATGRRWRNWVTMALAAAAILSPADPFSMLVVAIPFVTVTILCVYAYRRMQAKPV